MFSMKMRLEDIAQQDRRREAARRRRQERRQQNNRNTFDTTENPEDSDFE